MHEKISKLFDHILSDNQGDGIEHIALAAHVGNKRGVSVFEAKIDSVDISDEVQLGVWLKAGGRWGCSTLEHAEVGALQNAVEQAKLAASFSDADPDYALASSVQYDGSQSDAAADVHLSMQEFESLALQMEERAKAVSPRVKNVPKVGCGSSLNARIMANSDGMRVVELNNFLKAGLSVMAAGDDKRMVNCYEIDFFTDKGSFTPLAVVDEVAHEAVMRVDPQSVKGGEWPIVFDPRCAAQLLSTFSACFSGDFLYRKLARLEGKAGQSIASPGVAIFDSSQVGLVKHRYDAEGTACQDRFIIKAGVFEGFLHNYYTARKSAQKTTGHAAAGIGAAPAVTASNMRWDGTGVAVDQLYQEMGTGILVKELHGASASPISGDFSYGAIGYWVENGRVAHPVADFTVAGNFFDLLHGIIGIGDDLRYVSPHGMGSYGGRSLLVKSLAVSSQ